jgi:hypothetical protein
VIESNGQVLPYPIPLTQERVVLGLGHHVIEWTSTDLAILDWQDVEIVPAVRATGAVTIGDRARIVSGEDNAVVVNAGNGLTRVGIDAEIGGLFTRGAVEVLDSARIEGDIEAGGPVMLGTDVEVFGTISENADVFVPTTSPMDVDGTSGTETV